MKKKIVYGLTTCGINKAKAEALDLGYLDYGNGGVTMFFNDFIKFCFESNPTALNSFKEFKKNNSLS